MFNFLKKTISYNYDVDVNVFRRGYMTRGQLDEKSKAADQLIKNMQLASMNRSDRYHYHLAELRWWILVAIAPTKQRADIEKIAQSTLRLLRNKYDNLH